MDLTKAINRIQKGRCPRHNFKPIFIKKDNAYELICCCHKFEEEVKKRMVVEKEILNLENINNFLMNPSIV
jgi:hypothetical protein